MECFLRAQNVGEVLHLFPLGQRDIPVLRGQETHFNNMVGMKSVSAWNNKIGIETGYGGTCL
jgi:hypothetical protein